MKLIYSFVKPSFESQKGLSDEHGLVCTSTSPIFIHTMGKCPNNFGNLSKEQGYFFMIHFPQARVHIRA
jgi:hypothetical protein